MILQVWGKIYHQKSMNFFSGRKKSVLLMIQNSGYFVSPQRIVDNSRLGKLAGCLNH